MFTSEKSLKLTHSASALSNNISSVVIEQRSLIYYTVVSKCSVNLLCSAIDGHAVNQKLIICKDPKTSEAYHILQARLLCLMKNVILVIAADKCIQFYDVESSTLIFHYNLTNNPNDEIFSRGICAHNDEILCGTNTGFLLLFNISAESSKISNIASLEGHKSEIWDITSHMNKVISCDDFGSIMIWTFFNEPKKSIQIITGQGYPCTSVVGLNEVVVGAFGSGHIRIFDLLKGDIIYEITAHANWINSLDIASINSVIISAGEDSFVRLWKLTDTNIQNIHNEHVKDERLQGVKFVNDGGQAFVCSAYDSDHLFVYVKHR